MNRAGSEPTSAGPQGSGARRRLSLRTVLITVVAFGALLLIADQITKNWAEGNLTLHQPQPFIGEILQLTLLYNSGAAWGMGAGITPVVTVLQLGIVLGVVVFTVKAVRSTWYAIAMSLILGGALGNIHDRLLRPPGPFRGEVVDFLELPNWPVFNVADMAVVGGAILVILLGLVGVPADPAVAEAEAAEKAAAKGRAAAKGKAAAERAEQAPSSAGPGEAGPGDAGPGGVGRDGTGPGGAGPGGVGPRDADAGPGGVGLGDAGPGSAGPGGAGPGGSGRGADEPEPRT